MNSELKILASVGFLWVFLSGCCNVAAQSQPIDCSAAPSVQFNMTLVNGTWYEVQRSPAPSPFKGCIEVDVYQEPNNGTWQANTTYSGNPAALYMHQSIIANITLYSNITNGLNLTYAGQNQNVTIKLLASDFNSYVFLCGYTNATDNSTSFGALLTRKQTPNYSDVTNYLSKIPANYTNLMGLTNITQVGCVKNAASTTAVPVLSTIFALFYTLLKLAN